MKLFKQLALRINGFTRPGRNMTVVAWDMVPQASDFQHMAKLFNSNANFDSGGSAITYKLPHHLNSWWIQCKESSERRKVLDNSIELLELQEDIAEDTAQSAPVAALVGTKGDSGMIFCITEGRLVDDAMPSSSTERQQTSRTRAPK